MNIQLAGMPPAPKAGLSSHAVANAYAAADPRHNVKEFDRPGMSRGKGAYSQAGIRAGQGFVQGISDAYSQQMQNANTLAEQELENRFNQEQYATALGGLAAQADYAQQMQQLQQMGALYGLIGQFNR